ncbi:uncharacterized protein LOC112151418 [Oryzias melastigma]|uniref:uncharacterized protein LOC112151418 n=1 Tax=Oryzias melastigma TaxID=30732 RepID=UPI000CF7C19A|nr:uncharacterized protein LOC112151418 [Oryzias melastigma]
MSCFGTTASCKNFFSAIFKKVKAPFLNLRRRFRKNNEGPSTESSMATTDSSESQDEILSDYSSGVYKNETWGQVEISTSTVCKFSNCFENCWLNSTFQAALNINIIRHKIFQMSRKAKVSSSEIPLSTEMFLTALKKPGMRFNSSDMLPVLEELSKFKPELRLMSPNDPADFAEPFLEWLNACGIKTKLQIKCKTTCVTCKVRERTVFNQDNLFFIAQPSARKVSLTSLFIEAVKSVCGNKKCSTCSANVNRQISFGNVDLITLYLPRYADADKERRYVTPPAVIEIPVYNGKYKYRLATVICHKRQVDQSAHYLTYISNGEVFIKANDEKISIARNEYFNNIKKDGTIFFYEKCT